MEDGGALTSPFWTVRIEYDFVGLEYLASFSGRVTSFIGITSFIFIIDNVFNFITMVIEN